MQKRELIRIHHMLDDANEAAKFVRDKDRVDLDNDRMLIFTIYRSLITN